MTAAINLFEVNEFVCRCCVCDVAIMATPTKQRQLRDNARPFWCINGHEQSFRETEAARLKRKLETVQKRVEWAEQNVKAARERADAAEHARAIAQGKLRAQSKRVKNGVCPCCNRTFQNLMRHMATKHPDFEKE